MCSADGERPVPIDDIAAVPKKAKLMVWPVAKFQARSISLMAMENQGQGGLLSKNVKVTVSAVDLEELADKLRAALADMSIELPADICLSTPVGAGERPVRITSLDEMGAKAKLMVWPAAKFDVREIVAMVIPNDFIPVASKLRIQASDMDEVLAFVRVRLNITEDIIISLPGDRPTAISELSTLSAKVKLMVWPVDWEVRALEAEMAHLRANLARQEQEQKEAEELAAREAEAERQQAVEEAARLAEEQRLLEEELAQAAALKAEFEAEEVRLKAEEEARLEAERVRLEQEAAERAAAEERARVEAEERARAEAEQKAAAEAAAAIAEVRSPCSLTMQMACGFYRCGCCG